MSIVGVVVVVDPHDEAAIERLGAVPGITLGPRRGARVALVIDEAEAHVRGRLEELQGMPGVLSVSPVFHAPEPLEAT